MPADTYESAFSWYPDDETSEPSGGPSQGSGMTSRNKQGHDLPVLAVFGGLYAVWTIAWVLAIVAAPTQQASSLLDAITYQFGEFLAIVAAPLWFGVVWWLSASAGIRARLTWLVAGLVVMFPLPLVLPVVFS